MQIILKESVETETFPLHRMEHPPFLLHTLHSTNAPSILPTPLPSYPTPQQKANISSSLHWHKKANVGLHVTIQSSFSSAIEIHSLNIYDRFSSYGIGILQRKNHLQEKNLMHSSDSIKMVNTGSFNGFLFCAMKFLWLFASVNQAKNIK